MTKQVIYRSDVHKTDKVFFDPCGDNHGLTIQDVVLSNGRGHYGGKTLEEYREEYPLMMIVDWKQAHEWIEEYDKSEPQEISEDDFDYMLEVLPPVGWVRRVDCESFKMSERYHGDITSIIARIGDRFFSFKDVIYMNHDHIMEKITNSAAYKAKQ